MGMTRTSTAADALTTAELTAWLTLRGVRDDELAGEVAEHTGKTLEQMDELYDHLHGER